MNIKVCIADKLYCNKKLDRKLMGLYKSFRAVEKQLNEGCSTKKKKRKRR